MAFEFPQEATSEDAFWQMLCEGRSASTEFPPDRLNINAFYHPDQDRPSTIPLRGGHFVKEDIGAFDAPFFSITQGEAACMDPQHRRMLETAYHALEDAGIPISQCNGSDTSVYTGSFTNDYLSILQQDYQAEQRHGAMGIAPSMLANRLSWFFNFKGTSMNIDSACSSSLIALHLAAQDLRAGNSSMALVGGANLVYHPNFMKLMSDFNFLSKDSRCWSFDERANGYSRGEGTAVIVVKRLSDALQNGDTIRAVIRNTGSNQDGRTPGITQPSMDRQVDLIEKTYEQARIDMAPTVFFEAHGTGTPVGDPVEASAIGAAFGKYKTEHNPLYIGAVKANIGHLEGCSGLAGIIKAVLVLENGVIPPIAGLESLSRQIQAQKLPLKFPTKLVPWPSCEVRRACINSFGFGGTNAVAILDDAYHYLKLKDLRGFHRTRYTPSPSQTPTLPGAAADYHQASADLVALPKLLVWSAPDEGGARRVSHSYERYIRELRPSTVADLAYTLAVRRSDFTWKSFVVAGGNLDASTGQLTSTAPVKATSNRQVAFVFTGQGAQYLNMGRELLDYPVFRQSIERSDMTLGQLGCPYSLFDILDAHKEVDVNQPQLAQPVTTCLQIALVDLLLSFGISPSVVMGHSSGEVAAAYAAGALSVSSAIKTAYFRGIFSSDLASQIPDVTMMAVGLSREHIHPYLSRLHGVHGAVDVEIGCINSPRSITLTGKGPQLSDLETWLKEDGIFARRLRVPMAYHSRFMKAIAGKYAESLASLDNSKHLRSVPMISSVTGDIVAPQRLVDAEYWVRNMTSPVEFEAAFAKLMAFANQKPRKQLGQPKAQGYQVTHLLEIGPHSALQGPIRECLETHMGVKKPLYIPSLVRGRDASVALLQAVGMLACAGFPVDLLAVNCLAKDISRPIPPGMPRYPFNHEKKYWIESSLSTNFRFQEAARHDLLGMRSLDWNPQMAQWRNVMRLAELPWLEDHTIAGEIVFPGAGYVVMAIEALKQLHGAGSPPILGVHVKEASFSHPIRFPQGTQQVETQITLSTQPQHANNGVSWSQFRIFVMDNGSYAECSSGWIRPVFEVEDRDRVLSLGPWGSQGWSSRIRDSSSLAPTKDPYGMLGESAVWYGPTFRNLEQMRLGQMGEATAQLDTSTWKLRGSTPFSPRYSVHPSTMDGLAQLVVPALSQLRSDLPTMVPVRAAGIWVDCCSDILQDGKMEVSGECELRGYRGAAANCVATAVGSEVPLVYLQGLETTFINNSRADDLSTQSTQPRNSCARIVWKPDVDLLSPEELLLHCARDRPPQEDDAVDNYRIMTLAIMTYIEEALAFLDTAPPNLQLERHLQAFVAWMRYQQERLVRGELPVDKDSVQELLRDAETRENLIRHVENYRIDGRFFMTVGRSLIKILRGEVDPLQLIFHDGLADAYYEEMLANEHHAYPASQYLDLLCFKNPSMKILEVGAGTGGQTLRSLESMSSDGVLKWARYDYTDISPAFFGQARSKFKEYAAKMDFKVCDISKDPVAQSFEANSYDLVIASHVLHATDVLNASLRHVRKLLKPGGKLLLFETTAPEAILAFAFGLLKGWWSPLDHEPRSAHSPCLTTEQWNERLKLTGFSGVDLHIPGQEKEETRYSSIIVSSAVEPAMSGSHAPALGPSHQVSVSVLVDEKSEAQLAIAKSLDAELTTGLGPCTIHMLPLARAAEMDTKTSSLTVSLLEVDSVLLDGISEPDYLCMRSVLARDQSVLWVSRSRVKGPSDPRHGLADGLGRVLMSEDSARKFATLSLDGWDREDPESITQLVSALVRRIIAAPTEDVENAYTTSDGIVHISRVYEHSAMDKMVAEAILPRQTREERLGTMMVPLSLRVETPGHVDTLGWFEDTAEWDTSRLAANEIVVRVKAIGLTDRDLLVASGKLNERDLGLECAGVVEAAGQESGFERGDKVCCLAAAPAGAATLIRVNAEAATAITPAELSFTDAVALISAAWTSYHSLVNVARIRAGESVLIHRAANPEGQLAIQMARNLGAHVFATVSSPAERAVLRGGRLRVPDEAIFSIGEGSFREKIAQATQDLGVDVVIGPLADDADKVDFTECLGLCGRIVDTSIQQQGNSVPPMTSGGRNAPSNVSRALVDMKELLRKNPSMAYNIFQRAMAAAFEASLDVPRPIHVFHAADAAAAFRPSQSPEDVGKKVIALDSDMTITANVQSRPQYHFLAEATYVIAGGLGGLGRSFARWMVGRGAKNLILLSRSGVQTAAARLLVSELESQGVRVEAPPVDISHLEKLREVLESLKDTMPPIRGCIQATVALRDNLFPNMTYDDWMVSTRAKVTGSWNLHTLLPEDLDFFIFMSSLNGIMGGRAQANYGAGNTFKDALARYRLQLGQKAVSIDLGLMVTEGIVAENEHLLASMRRIGHLMDIHQEELLALLDHYCNPNLPVLDAADAQILVGLERPDAIRAKGIDLHHAIHRPMFRHLFQMGTPSQSSLPENGPASAADRASLLSKAGSLDKAAALVCEWFTGKIAHTLGLAEEDVDVKKPLHTFNVDSLVAIDLKNWFAREIGAEVEVFALLGNTPIEQVAEQAATKSRYRQVEVIGDVDV
ncbi:hypothetical protein ACRALDRAFT_1040872 [Sodiomyces alcalophilus JCM 7366]|uniref:uncharacterized protein n=1 Tax=Sodiomyces alcalophilus JCM 7366 TaxID=591952 RepID=UPI0039B36EC3